MAKKGKKERRGRGKQRLSADTTVRFSRRKALSPADVILVDNRPGKLHRYHSMLLEAAANLSTGQPISSVEGRALDLSGVGEPETKALLARIENGLNQGAFKDTTRIAAWIALVNKFAKWQTFMIPQMKLVLAHAEQEIDRLLLLIKERRQHPAAIILSGSPKMFSEVVGTPVVQKTIELVRYAIKERIPVFGICFGMHLLAHVCYNEVPVEYLTVPKGMKYLCHGSAHLDYKPVTSGERHMHYGVAVLAEVKPDPVTTSLQKGGRSIGVHSQVVFLDQLLEHGCRKKNVLVLRTRRFASAPNLEAEMVTQTFVEVFRYAPGKGEVPIVYGSQQHPELTVDLIYALTFVRSFAAALEREGHDIVDLRARLRSYMYRHSSKVSASSAGARVGLNFFKHVLAPFYIHRLRVEERVTKKQAKRLRDRLKKWGRRGKNLQKAK